MNIEQVTSLLQDTLLTTLLVSAPVLVVALVVGLGISILQAATQVNEQTLTFVPKIVLVLATFGLLFPWIMGTIVSFGGRIMAMVATQVGS